MIKKIKSFYNKDYTDVSTGYVDPYEYHLTFYKILVAFKVADLKNKDPPSCFNQNAILFISGLIGTLLTTMSFCNGVKSFDFVNLTEAGAYTLILIYKLLILTCTRRNLPQFHNFLRCMKKDFEFICNTATGQKYRVQFFENQLKTWKISILACAFCAVVPVGMISFASLSLCYFLATYDADVGGSRPLLFPFWLPGVDFGKSPVYELAFMFANICVVLYSYNFTFLIQTHIVWVRHITSKVDIVIWSLQDLLMDIHPATSKEESLYFSYVIERRMREIVKHHQSMYSLMDDYANVYKKFLLYEQTFCGHLVCFTAYCIAEKLDEGEFPLILLILFVAAIVLSFVPSVLCTYLADKVDSVCEACSSIPFWNAGPVIRPYIVLIMQRSLRPLPLKAACFDDVSIETFSKKMTNAYSLFNMLRQTNSK